MNLPRFLKEVDETTNRMPQGALVSFIHDMARTLPESEREHFLVRLKEMQGGGKAVDAKKHNTGVHIPHGAAGLKEQLQSIEEGEICLEGYLNEAYDDWYDNEDDEFRYEDPEGVLDIIGEACDFVRQCVDCEEYAAGYEVAEILMGLKIMVDGDYSDYADGTFSVEELASHNLGSLDYERFVIDAVYTAYQANELSERAGAVYRMIENSGKKDITMEMVMQGGEELPETEEFLLLWIDYLGEDTSVHAQRLLKEAVELINDRERLLESARKYCGKHPALYELYLLGGMDKEDDETLLETGKEALKAIDSKYIVRSRIALWVSTLALKHGMRQEAEKCWLEAFRSDTTVVNYLRLLMECKDFPAVGDEAAKIYHAMFAGTGKDSHTYSHTLNGELAENHTGATTACLLAFFGGEFQYVKDHAMNEPAALGWSCTFMKCGLAAFLLLLLESGRLQQGGAEMCRRIVSESGFDKDKYQNGTGRSIEASSQDWFWECFCHWKSTITLQEEEREKFLEWIEKLVEKRVNGIMEGNRRNYYGECAAYIAALGEVKEASGETGGKQRLMREYKKLYSRRSAFHKALRGYGMRD